MAHFRVRPLSILTAFAVLLFGSSTLALAQSPDDSLGTSTDSVLAPITAPAATVDTGNYRDAAYVQISLGEPNLEAGIHLIDGQPDGQTRALTPEIGRSTKAGLSTKPDQAASADRFFYFDVHPTYISGGKNLVAITVTYRDIGFAPVFLEYDSFDLARPWSKADDVVKKRVPLFERTNSDETRTVRLELADARFGGDGPGGADFRIGSDQDLTLLNVSVILLNHEVPVPPRILLDGQVVSFDPNDVQPFIHPVTGRTLVPFRSMFNALGIPDSAIVWDGTARRIDVTFGGKHLSLTIDSDRALVDGSPVMLDQPATILAGRTVVPLRFVMQQFGLSIQWDEPTRSIMLTRPQAPNPAPPTNQPGTQPQPPKP
ncbi:MAG: copper amine oxidase N-terminal domain-containing protein [Mycobacterium leprae]